MDSMNNIPIARVRSVHFCMQSSEEIRKQSVCRVFNPEAMDRNKQVPNSGGVLDPRMGSIDRRFDCSTCGNDYVNCPGHFGHIDLPCPFYSNSFISRTYALLRSVCYFCSRLLVGRDDFRAFQVLQDKDVGGLVSKNTFSGITKAAKTKRTCPYEDCGMPQPKYDLDKMIITLKWDPTDLPILLDKGWRHVVDRVFTPKDAQLILEAVDPKDYEFLGLDPYYSHPAWSIFTAYPVIPPNVRPAEGPKRGQDDLTILLEHIVNSVHNIHEQIQKILPKWVPVQWNDLNAWFAKHKTSMEHFEASNYGAPSETWHFPPPTETPIVVSSTEEGTSETSPTASSTSVPPTPKRRGRKSANHAAIQNLSGSTSTSLMSFVAFKDLVQMGPREGHSEDILRLMPFVLWAFGWCGEDAKIINDIPVFRQAVLEPNDEITAWLWETLPRACLELQCHLTVIVNNDGRSIPQNMQSSGSQFKSIVARLNTKTGRIRGHLMGKRIDFTARSVISPGAELDVNEVGVPEILATILSVPETVNEYNEKRLADSIRVGHGVNGGATRVITKDGCITYLEFMKDKAKREYIANHITRGCIVERHLVDGDIVLFNRQPSLHKMSIMGHLVKILKNSKSFELPLPDTTCYNADFDGDEMNMHVLQTPESRAEALNLIEVSNYFISPQCHRAIIALVQNALLASYLFTIKDAFFDKQQVTHLLTNVKYFCKWKKMPRGCIFTSQGKELYTGKQIYSWFLHDEVHFFKDVDPPASKIHDEFADKNRIMHFSEPTVLIRKGELLTGRLCKKTVGATQGSIIDIMVRDVGKESVLWFLSDIQRVMSMYLKMRGFTVGIADCIVSSKTMQQTKSILQTLYDLPRPSEREDGEEEYILKKTTSAITDVANRLVMSELLTKTTRGTENAFLSMITSGSKGKVTDFETVITCVGQQLVNGHRIRRDPVQGFASYFKMSERHVMASGFLNHSYTHGLSPREMYDHFMGGREGLVDTAVKTADTGYTQRRLVKMMENLRIAPDFTVREGNSIVQFCYGATATNPSRYEWVKTKGVHVFTQEKILEYVPMFMNLETSASSSSGVPIEDAVLEFANRMLEAVELMKLALHSPLPVEELPRQFLTPVNWDRIFKRAWYKTPAEVEVLREKLDEYEEDLYPTNVSEILDMVVKYDKMFIDQVGPCETSVTRFLMYEKFLDNFEYSHEFFTIVWPFVYLESKRQWLESRCSPGDMVGILAAQSIGEPTTQMTLRTSHAVGKESETLLAGVPRMKEIIDMSDVRMSTPSMTIPILVENPNIREYVCGSQLQKMVRTFKIIKEPIGEVSMDDAWLMSVYKYFGEEVETDFDAIQGGWLNEDLYNTNLMATSQDYVCRLVLKSEEVPDICAVAYRLKTFWQEFAADIWDAIQVYYSPIPVADEDFKDMVYIVRVRACGIRILADTNAQPSNFEKFKKSAERYLCIHLRKIMQRAIRNISFGIDEIKRARFVEEKRIDWSGNLQKSTNIRTLGSAIGAIASVPFMDWYNTISNNIPEIYRELGIGAARTLLISELTKVLSCDGGYVLFSHIWMLVDTLTFRGFPMRANRHGQNRVNTGVLQRCSFEESASILQDSAFFSERDELHGLTPNLMVGQISPIGTGTIGLRPSSSVIMDPLRNGMNMMNLRDNIHYVTNKGFSTPRKERIDMTTGQAMPYRKINMTDKVQKEDIIPQMFLKRQSDKTAKYWTENASATSIIKMSDQRSFIRTDKTTSDVIVDLTSSGYAPNKRVRFEESTNQEWDLIMNKILQKETH